MIIEVGVRDAAFLPKVARAVGESGKVYGIDPADTPKRMFELNKRHNDIENAWFLQLAVSDMDEERILYSGSTGEQYSGFYETLVNEAGKVIIGQDDHTHKLKVKSRTIDSLVDELKIDRLDLVILEINGAEILALKGMERTLVKLRPNIVMAAVISPDKWDDPKEIAIRFIKPFGYEVTGFMEGVLFLSPVENRTGL